MKNEGNADKKVIQLLKNKKGSYLSGQVLSKTLDISRTAVWKHMNAIKAMGYDIEASPAKGYKLNQEILPFNALEISSGLATSFIGKNISFYKEIESTNDTAREMALNGAAEGAAVVADFQKKGKGRLGRQWESPAGVNIYTSIILRPDILPLFAPQLTLVSAVAVAETISKFLNPLFDKGGPGGLSVKWPNDILIHSKKVAGILTEMNAEMDRINFVVIGIGVNINMAERMFPEDLCPIATSLKKETGDEISRIDFLQTLYRNVENWYGKYLKERFEPIRHAWKGYFRMAGKLVRVHQMDKVIEGIAKGIDADGALILQAKNGNIVKIMSGDVTTV